MVICVERDHVYLLIDTKTYSNHEEEKGNRAFTKTGVKGALSLFNKNKTW